MAGLQAVMAGYWDENEPGVPWRVRLYVDVRADEPRRAALADVFLGRGGGTPARNYTAAIKDVYGIRAARIDVFHERGRQGIRVDGAVTVLADPKGLARSLPGMGEVGAANLVAAIGRPGRFSNGRQVRSFCGLTPKSSETGETDRKGQPLTKAGRFGPR